MYCIVISFIYIFVMQNIIQMKSIAIIISSLIFNLNLLGAGPGKGAAEIYEMVESKCSSSFSLNFNKDLKDLFDMDLDLNGKEKLVKGDFSRGKFLVVDKEESNYKDILNEFKKRGYSLVDIEEDDEEDEVFMMVDQKGDNIKEVHFIMNGDEKVVMLSIYGDIHLEKK